MLLYLCFLSDQGEWLFLTPRKALAKEASSLEKRAEEQIKVYLHNQQKELKRFHKNLHYLATTAKKKYPNTVVMVPDGSSSSKVYYSKRILAARYS